MTESRTSGTRSTAPKSARPRRRTTDDDASETRRAASSARQRDADEPSQDGDSGHRTPKLKAHRAAAMAAAQVRELTGKTPEGVTGLERLDDGWRVRVEVLESRRIPDSTDLLALYRVDLDADGDLVGYRRERRYHRGRPEEDT
ncbi:gas vesicle protein GvpO [Streptacidiphilus neutrinimicus]|uniref:gas vesicle protein GvpO n=1 Tax=Streptacidiphilus neutrinimicus TaxID=105420 RepID=UPI0007C8491C|nr:gas vesicle protein GvpO [Streptacidiphilus neutrinimicus]